MWCSFHEGNKKRQAINDATEKSSDNLKMLKEIDEAVDRRVTEMFSVASLKLIKFLKDTPEEIEDDDTYEIPTAVVLCSFSNVDIFRKALAKNLDNKKFIVVDKDSKLRNIIDEARKINDKDSGVFLIKQIESLSSEFIENLIYSTQWHNIRFPFIICVSTDMCSLVTLRSLNAEVFHMPKPKDIFNNVMESILKETIERDIFLSGQVLTLLRSRYFSVSYSVKEIKRALRLFVQENCWKLTKKSNNTKDKVTFQSFVTNYWKNLIFYTEKTNQSLFQCHEAIQTGSFTVSNKLEYSTIKEWLEKDYVYDEIRNKMNKRLELYIEAKSKEENEAVSPQKVQVKKQDARISAVQFKQEMEKKRQAILAQKQLSPSIIFEKAVKEMVQHLFQPWSEYPGSEDYLVTDEQKKVLYCDPAESVENALLKEENKDKPLAIAYKTLQQRNNWKNAHISEWLKDYEKEVPSKDKENTIPSFYASLGQLESMGVIKSAGEKKKDLVAVIHHPLSHVLN